MMFSRRKDQDVKRKQNKNKRPNVTYRNINRVVKIQILMFVHMIFEETPQEKHISLHCWLNYGQCPVW